jgi:hypothetical protein
MNEGEQVTRSALREPASRLISERVSSIPPGTYEIGGRLTTTQKNRSRLISFRLSPGEYDDIREALNAEGGRSLSEYARAAVMQRMLMHQGSKVSLGEDLLTLSTRLRELDSGLTELSKLIRRVLGANGK